MAKLSLLLPLLLLHVLLTFVATSLSCPEHQKQALLHFKASIINATSLKESTLYRLDSWNSSSDCCHWDGVSCSSHFGFKTVLALYLDGIIPSNSPESVWLPSTILTPLFHIRSLMHLDLSDNWMQGELPGDGFANLSKLVYLDMNFNSFHGILSGEMGSLSSLRVLGLYGNSLRGNIPKEIGNMTKLQELSLGYNNFFGEIPSSISYLKELKRLFLPKNSLSMEIPFHIGNLSNIKSLYLGQNKLTGTHTSSLDYIFLSGDLNPILIILFHRNFFIY